MENAIKIDFNNNNIDKYRIDNWEVRYVIKNRDDITKFAQITMNKTLESIKKINGKRGPTLNQRKEISKVQAELDKAKNTSNFFVYVRGSFYCDSELVKHNWYSDVIESWEKNIVKSQNYLIKLGNISTIFTERLDEFILADIGQITSTEFWEEHWQLLRPHPIQLRLKSIVKLNRKGSMDLSITNYYEVLTLLKQKKCGFELAQEETDFLSMVRTSMHNVGDWFYYDSKWYYKDKVSFSE